MPLCRDLPGHQPEVSRVGLGQNRHGAGQKGEMKDRPDSWRLCAVRAHALHSPTNHFSSTNSISTRSISWSKDSSNRTATARISSEPSKTGSDGASYSLPSFPSTTTSHLLPLLAA